MMQVLIDGEVWFGNPGFDALTYDPTLVLTLPRRWGDLIDPTQRRDCVALWTTLAGCWFSTLVHVDVTLVRAQITEWYLPPLVAERMAWWWGPDEIQKYLRRTL
ncbi:MAG: hypothetical protein EBR40_11495 [Proteobacteria bacterium]|nr:hypothetical protein [Pseudomonadota bacterium]